MDKRPPSPGLLVVGSVYRASRHPGGQAAHDGRHLGFCGPRDPSRENGASDPAGGSCANGIAGGCTSRKRGRPVGTEAVRESVPARFAQAGFVRCAKAHRAKVAPPAIRAPRLRQKVSGRPRIGVTNPGDEQSSPGGARGGESRIGPLNQRRSADHVASPRRGGEATREGRSRGKPRGMPERGSGDRGGARGSWRLQASVLGALHRHAKASGRGTRIEARRSDSSRSTSFDEAAVQAGLALPQKERDRERQRLASDRPVGRTGRGEGALPGRCSIERLQVRAGRVPRETRGHRGSDQSWRTAVKRGSTRGHVVRAGFGLRV